MAVLPHTSCCAFKCSVLVTEQLILSYTWTGGACSVSTASRSSWAQSYKRPDR